MPWKNCKVCENNFYAKPRNINRGWGKYCSRSCHHDDKRNGYYVKCKTCHKDTYRTPKHFKRAKKKNFFCDKSCHMIWKNKNSLAGENHPQWKNGENAYRNIMLKSGRKEICENCGVKNKRVLVVHHIDENRKNNTLENLRWLCRNCHYLTHNGKTV